MVVFTCNHCGESLHKPKVEKHYNFKCRKAKSLTCVDCLKDFHNEDYSAHVKCVTEEERYSAKGAFAGGNVKKGEAKQESWIEMIKSIVDREKSVSPSIRNLLNIISAYTNVPRKKAKFINFVTHSTGGRVAENDIIAVWDIIEKYKAEQAKKQNGVTTANKSNNKRKVEEKNNNTNNESNGVNKKPKLEKKAKKEQATNDGDDEDNGKFNFQQKILKIVSKKGEISVVQLRKRVLKAYGKATGIEDIPKETIKEYKKQLRKIPNIVIADDKVSLME